MVKRVRLSDPPEEPAAPKSTAPAQKLKPNPLVGPRAPPGVKPKGARNRIPHRIIEAIEIGLEKHGMDGKGKNGLPGYFYFLASTDPKAMAHLVGRILPQKVQTEVDPQSVLGQLIEAARARLQMERARVIDAPAVTRIPPSYGAS